MKQEIRTGWKVVKRVKSANGRWKSESLTRDPCSPGYVIYPNRKWAYPRIGCGPLCVFQSHFEAKIFADRMRGLPLTDKKVSIVIFICRYKPSAAFSIWVKGCERRAKETTPRGTVLADAVMIMQGKRK